MVCNKMNNIKLVDYADVVEYYIDLIEARDRRLNVPYAITERKLNKLRDWYDNHMGSKNWWM